MHQLYKMKILISNTTSGIIISSFLARVFSIHVGWVMEPNRASLGFGYQYMESLQTSLSLIQTLAFACTFDCAKQVFVQMYITLLGKRSKGVAIWLCSVL